MAFLFTFNALYSVYNIIAKFDNLVQPHHHSLSALLTELFTVQSSLALNIVFFKCFNLDQSLKFLIVLELKT